jgi:hypothetical protein
MNSLPFGLSVHHFVSSVGADAGFAALIAVAILVLLYFAQARETATLRARADEAAFRVHELEEQVADLTDQVAGLPAEISVRATGPRVAAAQGGVRERVPAGAYAKGLAPAAPAGLAAPALAAATRLIPDGDRPLGQPAPATVGLYGAPAGDGAVAGGPAPATAAGAANGSAHRPVPVASATVPRPVPVAAGAAARPGSGPPRGGAGQGRPAGAGPPRPGAGPSRPGGPARPQATAPRPAPRRSWGRLALGAAVAALGLAAVAAAVIVLTGNSNSSSASRSSASESLITHRTRAAAVVPSTVTVSVLNGTDQQGLALHVSDRLIAEGYRKGAVNNASDQTQTTSVVAYMTPADKRDALAVATALKLSRSAVRPIDANTKAIACPPNQPCSSAVVVTIGHDIATQ